MPAKYPRCGPVPVRLEHRAHRPRRVGGWGTVNTCPRYVADHRSFNDGARRIFGLRSRGQPVCLGGHVVSPCAGPLLREQAGGRYS
jgi:hypothetical protein